MKRTITATELKNNLGKYLDHVIENNEVIITKNGKKAVRMSPYITDYDRYYTLKEQSADYMYERMKVSYEEFMEIYEKSELRMEFINGEIIILGSPTADHQEISGNLYVILRSHFRGSKCKVFYAPFDVHFYKEEFKDPDVMQPDLIVACDTDEKMNEKGRYMGTPTLTVEILSPSTRSRDMVDKLNTFMLSGVKEYWIVDPKSHIVIVYAFANHDIADFTTYRLADTIESPTIAGLQVPVNEIFAS